MNKFLFLIIFLMGTILSAKTIEPQSVPDLYKTSVRIYNPEMSSGGTGSVFKSFKTGTHILTNKHVCRLIEQGGTVLHKTKKYKVTHYKKFPQHDLCLVRVGKNLKLSTKIAKTLSERSSTVFVSGHPNLLPHIVTKGHLSDRMDIQLVIGTRDCDPDNTTVECAWFGGKPVVRVFDSQVISNLIKPGSSGSAVFNEDGHIVGVVYAGDGRGFSHGFIVPHLYVIFFVQNAHRFDWIKVGTPVDDEGLSNRIFNYEKCHEVRVKDNRKYDNLKEFCNSIQDNFIWRKK